MLDVDMSQVESALTRLRASFPQVTAAAVLSAGQVIEREAKARCDFPNSTGTLRASLTTELKDATPADSSIVATVGTNVLYAPYVHQGTGIYALHGDGRKEVPWHYIDPKTGEWRSTKGLKPKQFLSQAAEAKRGEIVEAVRQLFAMLEAQSGN